MPKKLANGLYRCECKTCGAEYEWRTKWSEICPGCRSASQKRRWENRDGMAERSAGMPATFSRRCVRCGGPMTGRGSRATLCKDCEAKRKNTASKAWRRKYETQEYQARANAGFLVGECLPEKVEWRGQRWW